MTITTRPEKIYYEMTKPDYTLRNQFAKEKQATMMERKKNF